MLCRFVGKKKYRKRVFLITDGEKATNFMEEEIAQVISTIKEQDIKLNCITIDFCNELAEDEEEEIIRPRQSNETQNQKTNKDLLLRIQKETASAIIPAETAIQIYH
jgi:nitrogenase subunit NifH